MPLRPALLALWIATLPACVISGGPDCAAACDKAVKCDGLDRDWLLACSPFAQQCSSDLSACAACITVRDCGELIGGACDEPCRPLGAPTRLDLDEPRPVPDPRLKTPKNGP